MIQSLCRLLKRFVGSVFKSELAASIEDHEPVARFIFSGEHFATSKGLVKPKAFLPDPGGETSVFRIFSLSSHNIWSIGNSIRADKAKAYGKVMTAIVRRTGLQVNAAAEEHSRHAVITGWPIEKDRKLMLALQLSKAASLYVQN